MKVIIIGAGGTARDLLRRLGDRWDVTVVDTDPERLERAGLVRDIIPIEGDGSSRVVLEQAGYRDGDALVAATRSDDVNLEICRIAVAAGLLRVVAVARDPERLHEYRALGISSFAPASIAARQLEIAVEPRRVSSTSFADGRAEALEFKIAEDSPVRGSRLREMHSESWLVAAVLRNGALIVPHGDTEIMLGDLVTVVGAAQDFSRIVRTFTAGVARFPLDFGQHMAVALDGPRDLEGPVAEAVSFVRATAAVGLIVVHRRTEGMTDESRVEEIEGLLDGVTAHAEGVDLRFRPVAGVPSKALAGVLADESVGAVVVPAPGPGILAPWRAVRLLRRTAGYGKPVLVSRQSYPYNQIVAPARDTETGAAAGRAAIDIAATAKAVVTGVAVIPPVFLVGEDRSEEAKRALARLREDASVQHVTVRRRLRQGNPVRVIEEVTDGANLLVVGSPGKRPSLLRPGIDGHLIARIGCSVLVVPPAP